MPCHAQIEGTPSVHALTPPLGAPKKSLPMIAPGPTAKNSHVNANAHTTGRKKCFSGGSAECSRKNS